MGRVCSTVRNYENMAIGIGEKRTKARLNQHVSIIKGPEHVQLLFFEDFGRVIWLLKGVWMWILKQVCAVLAAKHEW